MGRTFWILVMGWVFLVPAPITLAQESGPSDEAQRIERQVDRRIEQLRRGLELSEGQVEKLRPLLTAYEREQSRIRLENGEKIRQILTPDQSERYTQLQSRRGGRSREGGRRFGPGQIMERLRDQLELSPEQEGKLQAIFDGAQEEMRSVFAKAREGGFQNMDWGKLRETMTEYWGKLSDKVRVELSDAQKPKYDEMVKEMQNNPWMRGFEGRGNREGRNDSSRGDRERRERPRRDRDPAELAKRRHERAMTALALSDEEGAVLSPLIQRILELQTTGRQTVNQSREALSGLFESGDADEESVKKAMQAMRSARTTLEQQLEQAREELRGLLTISQEGQMLEQGILD